MSHVRDPSPMAHVLAPVPVRRVRAWETVAVLVLGIVVSFPRSGAGGFRGVVWAEDGTVFLHDAYRYSFLSRLFEPYAGYGHVGLRVVTEVISRFPLEWHGVLMRLAGVTNQALVAVLAFHVVSAHVRGRLGPWLVALAVVAIPTGESTIGNLANAQWYLLVGGCLVALWSPRGRVGRAASVLVVAVLCLSSVFGVAAVAVAALVWLVGRRRQHLVLVLVGVAGCLAQGLMMLGAPGRTKAGPVDPGLLPRGYLTRVLGDGVFGVHFELAAAPTTSPWRGFAALVLLLVLGAVVYRRHRLDGVLVPGLLLLLSLGSFVAFQVLSGADSRFALGNDRYYVPPVLFLATALALLAARAVTGSTDGAEHAEERWIRGSGMAATGVLVASLAFGMVTSWDVPKLRRDTVPGWAAQVAHGREVCARSADRRTVRILLAPPGWQTRLSCATLGR